MHIIIASIAAGILLVASIANGFGETKKPTIENTLSLPQNMKPDEFTAAKYKPGIVRHIVLFRYKAGVTEAQRSAVLTRFLSLKKTALRHSKPYILSIHAGTQNSYEGSGQGFVHAFIVEFRSEGDRNYYVGTPAVTDPAFYDPQHQKFKQFVGPLLDKNGAIVFDFAN